MNVLNRLLSVCVAVLLLAFAGAASAQVNVPSTAQPSRESDRLSIQPEMPEVSSEPLITIPGTDGQAAPVSDKTSFTLKQITLQGNTALSEEVLKGDYENYIGEQVTLNTLNEIVGKITARYRNAGYILSRAVLPAQRIEGGRVKILVVEGRIGNVEFQGVPDEGVLHEYAQKLRDESPLSAQSLERYLLLMDDLPGVTARAVIRPSEDALGAADLVVVVTQKMFDGSASLDNRGTRYMGPVQGGLTLNINNAIGLYERTQLRGVNTAKPGELHYMQLVHEQQLGAEGTKVALSASHTESSPQYLLRNFDIEGMDNAYSLAVSHPFIRSRQSNLYVTFTLDARETNNSALQTQIYHDSLRVARLGAAYDFIDSWLGVNRLEATASRGFGWGTGIDGAVARSRARGRPEFYKGTVQASRLQQIDGPFSLYVAASGQAASNILLAAEQFGLGGATFGSAYDPSENTGDSGIIGRGELRYSREGDFELIPAYQLYVFYDAGKVWTRGAAAGADNASLVSAGGGVRFNVLEPVSGSLEFAQPINQPVASMGPSGYQPRVFFSLVCRY